MPTPFIKKIAKKQGVSIDTAESHWARAKKIVDEQYEISKESEKYWQLVTSIFKKMMGVHESIAPVGLQTFLEFTRK